MGAAIAAERYDRKMPTVAIVEGVKIQFFAREHPPAHFHAVFAEFRVQIAIESLQVMKGSIPQAKLRTAISWAEPRRDKLRRAWETVTAKKKPEKIT
jgi:uncharacterized protein DUF4160